MTTQPSLVLAEGNGDNSSSNSNNDIVSEVKGDI